MFDLAQGYSKTEMSAYSTLQNQEFLAEGLGYTATKHQREVGTSCFDMVNTIVTGGQSATLAMRGSTDEAQ